MIIPSFPLVHRDERNSNLVAFRGIDEDTIACGLSCTSKLSHRTHLTSYSVARKNCHFFHLSIYSNVRIYQYGLCSVETNNARRKYDLARDRV